MLHFLQLMKYGKKQSGQISAFMLFFTTRDYLLLGIRSSSCAGSILVNIEYLLN